MQREARNRGNSVAERGPPPKRRFPDYGKCAWGFGVREAELGARLIRATAFCDLSFGDFCAAGPPSLRDPVYELNLQASVRGRPSLPYLRQRREALGQFPDFRDWRPNAVP